MRRWPLVLTGLLGACSSDPVGTDAGITDAGLILPSAAEVLPSASYDCRFTGVATAPTRPHAVACFRDPSCKSRLLAGHRMAVPFAPENSRSALRAAILLGVDIAETDARMTKDGTIVLLHDGTIDRTTTGTGAIATLTLAQAQSHALVVPSHLDGDFSCERLMTLDEALEISVGQIVLELEVKADAAGLAVARTLRDRGLYDSAYLLCDVDECAQVRAEVPDVPIMSRPHAPEEVAGALLFTPPPTLVHIDPNEGFLAPGVLDAARQMNIKIFANGFILGDALALSGDGSGYAAVYDKGVDVQQVQNIHWALAAMGRLTRRP